MSELDREIMEALVKWRQGQTVRQNSLGNLAVFFPGDGSAAPDYCKVVYFPAHVGKGGRIVEAEDRKVYFRPEDPRYWEALADAKALASEKELEAKELESLLGSGSSGWTPFALALGGVSVPDKRFRSGIRAMPPAPRTRGKARRGDSPASVQARLELEEVLKGVSSRPRVPSKSASPAPRRSAGSSPAVRCASCGTWGHEKKYCPYSQGPRGSKSGGKKGKGR